MNLFESIIQIIIGILPFIYGFVLSNEKSSVILYIPYIIIIGVFILFKINLKLNRQLLRLGLLFLIAYIIIPFITFKVSDIMYLALYFIFIGSLICVGSEATTKRYNIYIRNMMIGNGSILFFKILTHINEINATNIASIQNGNRQLRATYGYPHPNTTAMAIVVEVLLIYIYTRTFKKKKVLLLYGLLIPALLATASRTGTYCLIIFFSLEFFFYIKDKINNFIPNKMKIVLGLIACVLAIFTVMQFDAKSFVSSASGRGDAMAINLQLLFDKNSFITGMKPIPITSLLKDIPGLKITDVWYMTHLISFGFISLVVILINLALMTINFLMNKETPKYLLSIILMLTFYSGAENVMFVPGAIVSPVLWIIFFCQVNILNNKKGNNR